METWSQTKPNQTKQIHWINALGDDSETWDSEVSQCLCGRTRRVQVTGIWLGKYNQLTETGFYGLEKLEQLCVKNIFEKGYWCNQIGHRWGNWATSPLKTRKFVKQSIWKKQDTWKLWMVVRDGYKCPGKQSMMGNSLSQGRTDN